LGILLIALAEMLSDGFDMIYRQYYSDSEKRALVMPKVLGNAQ
jgi:hypothetical protein